MRPPSYYSTGITFQEAMMPGAQTRKRYIQTLLVFFILALTASGLTAIPLPFEISILNQLFGSASSIGQLIPPLGDWISFVHEGLVYAQAKYPFLAYGTD